MMRAPAIINPLCCACLWIIFCSLLSSSFLPSLDTVSSTNNAVGRSNAQRSWLLARAAAQRSAVAGGPTRQPLGAAATSADVTADDGQRTSPVHRGCQLARMLEDIPSGPPGMARFFARAVQVWNCVRARSVWKCVKHGPNRSRS